MLKQQIRAADSNLNSSNLFAICVKLPATFLHVSSSTTRKNEERACGRAGGKRGQRQEHEMLAVVFFSMTIKHATPSTIKICPQDRVVSP